MSRLQDAFQKRLDRTTDLRRLQEIGDEMSPDKFDKWVFDLRGSTGLQGEATRREAENDLARQKLSKLDEPKEYEKRMKTQAAKTAKLRAMRLAKEAEDAAAAALARETAPKPRRRATSTAK
jgi:prophage antirepressor-like protein